ncbi:MAG: flagellar basal-body MS-ring/collar protein FliF [Paracoccaceae bacterium]
MLNLIDTWTGLDRRKQILAVLAAVAVFVGILGMSRIATQPSWRLLYSGLESGTAGEVVRALEQRGAVYEVRGGSIYVEASSRDELRMTLASEGLPANGGRGYELLDSLSGFGTTSQMFDAAYWRAKEGELARTIVSAPYVSLARVHIANTAGNPFQRSVDPSASVSVTPSGAPITAVQAEALRHLVASAVAGLTADNVTVVDSSGQMIGAEEKGGGVTTALSRADQLRERVMRIVEARVGRGNAFVEVSVDTVTESEIIRERLVDPGTRVAISTDVEETANSSTSRAGEVSVNSNLPDGDAGTGDDSQAQTSATRERVNYEVSETEREVQRVPGEIKRLTVAVLVNGVQSVDDASAFEPRSEEELSALRELVESSVGFNADRGDVITIKSMDLPTVAPVGTEASASIFDFAGLDVMSLIQLAFLALVVLLLGMFVLRPILTRSRPELSALMALPEGTVDGTVDGTATVGDVEDGASDDAPGEGGPALLTSEATQQPVERLRAMIGDRQDETVEILRSWLEEQREKA